MKQEDSLSVPTDDLSFGLPKSQKKKSSGFYVRKDLTHGEGYFYRRKYNRKTPDENGKYVTYYWYYISHSGGKRDNKEYLGNSDDENTLPAKCLPRFKILYVKIQAARAYKPKHSRR